MKVAVTGANGMVGKLLVRELSARDAQVRALLRDASRTGDRLRMLPQVFPETADVTRSGTWQRALDGVDAVVHLAGPLLHASTAQTASQLRVNAAREVVRAVGEARQPPAVVVVASSVLAWGERSDVVDDGSASVRTPLSELALAPEALFLPLQTKTRVVVVRFAQILGAGGLLLAVKESQVLPEASGRAFSWISAGDAVSVLSMALRERNLAGIVVAASPKPVDCAQLRRALEPLVPKQKKAGGLAGLFGGGAAATKAAAALPLVAGVRARPSRLLALGAGFRDEHLDKLLAQRE